MGLWSCMGIFKIISAKAGSRTYKKQKTKESFIDSSLDFMMWKPTSPMAVPPPPSVIWSPGVWIKGLTGTKHLTVPGPDRAYSNCSLSTLLFVLLDLLST